MKALKDQKYQLLLAKNLYGSDRRRGHPRLTLRGCPSTKAAVTVRTHSAVTSEGFRPLAPNFYCAPRSASGTGAASGLTLKGCRTDTRRASKRLGGTIHFVDKDLLARTNGTIPIRYELHNEDEDSGYPPPRPGDEHFEHQRIQ